MSIILSIESSGPVCSAALHKDGVLMNIIESSEPNVHGEKLAVFIHELLTLCKIKVSDMVAVAVSRGPGSYTGLRIGVSLAKGICYASGIPLIAIDTLQSLACGIMMKHPYLPANATLIPMIDARRMEVYTAGFDPWLNKTMATRPLILDDSFGDSLNHSAEYFTAGSGSFKLKHFKLHKIITTFSEVTLSANYIGVLAWGKFRNRDFEDIAYFEPDYLKEFAAIIKTTKD